MTISVREQCIYVELEATYGTAETLVAADAILVEDLQVNPVENLRMLDRSVINSSLNPRKSIYGGSLLGFQFTVELKGSGTAGTASQGVGDLLQACAMSETVVGATSVTYAPLSDLSLHKGVTIGVKMGGNYRIAKGCRGTWSLNATTGQYAKLTFNMMGKIHSESAAAAPTPTFESTAPPAFMNAAFTIATVEFPINALTFDLSNTMSISPDPNETDGFGAIRVTARGSGGTIDPEEQLISTKDWVGILRAGTSQAIATGTVGGTAGNRWALNIPLAYFKSIAYADREELIIANITFGAEDTNGTNDFSLVYT